MFNNIIFNKIHLCTKLTVYKIYNIKYEAIVSFFEYAVSLLVKFVGSF